MPSGEILKAFFIKYLISPRFKGCKLEQKAVYMGSFTFIKEAGIKLSEMGESGGNITERASEKSKDAAPLKNPAASKKMEEMLNKFQLEISHLSVVVDGETVHLSGKAKDQETREKAILVVGNVLGISKVEEDLGVEKDARESQFHTVTPSDDLRSIAQKVYGDPGKDQKIFEANRPMLEKPNALYQGQVLRIPSPND